jgi:hypothetical protein
MHFVEDVALAWEAEALGKELALELGRGIGAGRDEQLGGSDALDKGVQHSWSRRRAHGVASAAVFFCFVFWRCHPLLVVWRYNWFVGGHRVLNARIGQFGLGSTVAFVGGHRVVLMCTPISFSQPISIMWLATKQQFQFAWDNTSAFSHW